MSEKEGGVKCAWDGDPSTWQDYVRRVRLTFEKTRSRKRRYLGPELVSQLSGRAWVVTQEIDHSRLVQHDGARFLIEYLEQRLGRVPVPDAGTKAEELFVKMRRPAGMTMAAWCHRVRETYRGLQRALKRARKEQDATSPKSRGSGDSRTSRRSRRSQAPTPTSQRPTPTSARPTPTSPAESPSSTRRRTSKQTVDEPEGDETPEGSQPEEQEAPDDEDFPSPFDDDPEDEAAEGRRQWKGKGRGSRGRERRGEDSETDTEDFLAGIRVWDDLDTGLPEVLPTELLGWLMLRRCSLSSQQRLNILTSMNNSLRADDIERGLRGAEEELRLHEQQQPKGSCKHKGRPVFWMEQGGEWALLNANEEDLEDWTADAHWVGGTQDLAANYGVLSSTSGTMTSDWWFRQWSVVRRC